MLSLSKSIYLLLVSLLLVESFGTEINKVKITYHYRQDKMAEPMVQEFPVLSKKDAFDIAHKIDIDTNRTMHTLFPELQYKRVSVFGTNYTLYSTYVSSDKNVPTIKIYFK